MEIGMSTASLFGKYMLEDAPARMRAYGVHTCEVFLNSFCEYEPEFIDLLVMRVREAGLQVYSVHAMASQFEPQLFSTHPRQRQDAWKTFERVLQAGQRLGAGHYVMHGPANLGGVVKNVQFSRIGPITHDLCALAHSYGIRLAWENVSWGLYCRPEFGPALLDAAKSEHLCFTLDIKQAARSGYSPLEYLARMGSAVENLHICDYRPEGERVYPALPGQGTCDYVALREGLARVGYRGPALYEVYSDLYDTEEQLLESYAYLKRQLGETEE